MGVVLDQLDWVVGQVNQLFQLAKQNSTTIWLGIAVLFALAFVGILDKIQAFIMKLLRPPPPEIGAERERELYAKAEAIREHQQRKFELAAREAADKKRELERQKVIESAAKMTGNVQSTRPDVSNPLQGGGGSGGYRPTKRTIKSCCTGTDC